MLTRRSYLAGLTGLATLPAAARAQESRYKGATVRFLTERNAHQLALAKRLGEVAKQWGVTLDVRNITTDEIEKKVMIDYVGGANTWDLVYTGGIQRMAQWAYGGVVKDIAPLIKSVGDPKLLNWDDFTSAARRAVTFGDKVFGLTVATSEQAMAYRKDLFEHPAERAAFKARFGYELAPPATYGQSVDTAAFFTRKAGEMLAGQALTQPFYGTALAEKRGTFMWHTFENFAAAFGVDIWDAKAGRSALAGPAGVAAVETMKKFIPSMPAGYINMSSGEIAEMFAAGQLAFIGEYFDRLLLNLGKGPVGLERAGFAFFPTAEGNPKGLVNGARSGPPVVSIYGRSAQAEVAYKLLEAATSSAGQEEMMAGSPAYLPSRVSALEALAKARPVTGYLLRLAESKAATRTDADLLPYPSIKKAAQVVDVVTGALSEIMVGAAVAPRLLVAQAAVDKIVGGA